MRVLGTAHVHVAELARHLARHLTRRLVLKLVPDRNQVAVPL